MNLIEDPVVEMLDFAEHIQWRERIIGELTRAGVCLSADITDRELYRIVKDFGPNYW